MITDPLFFQLFQASPETFFLLLGLSPSEAAVRAKAYEFRAVEVKEAAHRLDGVFIPKNRREPFYFVESLFYHYKLAFVDVFTKAFSFMKRNKQPQQPFKAVVVFSKRSLAPPCVGIYAALKKLGYLEVHYLNKMPETRDGPLGLSILKLIVKSKREAPEAARKLIERTQSEIGDEASRVNLVRFIETVIIYKLPKLGREEVRKMLGIKDIRKSRFYQEAKQDGVEETEATHLREKLQGVRALAALGLSAEQIAKGLVFDIQQVKQELAKLSRPNDESAE